MRPTEDQYRHKGLRKKLVEELREKGITDEQVLDAINKIPRHFFLESAFDNIAYIDKAYPIGEGQTISQPYTVAYQTQLLQCKTFNKVLEIGTGSGYQAAVLAALGVQVFTIERQKKLFDANRSFGYLQKMSNIKCFYGDGFEGLPTYAPFDKIIITAAAPHIPDKLLQQLKVGGVMVIPLNEGDKQRMLRITRNADSSYTEQKYDEFSFVPMLTGKANNQS
jgi:protein-L-isoaspartate(D-aspartate) O-methyltransferase